MKYKLKDQKNCDDDRHCKDCRPNSIGRPFLIHGANMIPYDLGAPQAAIGLGAIDPEAFGALALD
jgi:hypothetical protein